MPCTAEHREEEGYQLPPTHAVYIRPKPRLLKTPRGYLVAASVVAFDVEDADSGLPDYVEVRLLGNTTQIYTFGTKTERDEFVTQLIAAIEG